MEVELPEKLSFLREPHRYKVARGGRGGAKSWSFSRQLLAEATGHHERVLCCREIQKSIKQSVHKILKDQAIRLGIDHCWDITDTTFRSKLVHGSEFIFEGIRQNADQIKSYEGLTKCWVSEAHNVSYDSWELLIPTIREPDSEIWVDYNPAYEDDDTHQRFAVNPPEDCVSVLVNYYDNPWFPDVLEKERAQDKARLDKDEYGNKWLGKPKGAGRKVWANFDKKIHVREFKRELIAAKANCYMGMDPHAHYYPFCAWVALIPKNKRAKWPEDFYKHIYAEWPTYQDMGGYYYEIRKKVLYQGTLADMAKEIYAKDGIEFGIKNYGRFIDTRFAKGSGSWSWSTKTEGIIVEFAKKENGGLLFRMPPEKMIDAQKDVFKKDLEWNKFAEINEFNEPAFSVDPGCRNTIISLQNHRLEEGTERESDKYKEPSDVIRILWAGLGNFKYEDPNPEPDENMGQSQRRIKSWMG